MLMQATMFTMDELFACVELAYYYKNPNPHLSKVHISVKSKLEKGRALTPALVQEYVLRHLECTEAAGTAEAPSTSNSDSDFCSPTCSTRACALWRSPPLD